MGDLIASNLPLVEQLAYSTVRIQAISTGGNVSYGTGFYYEFPISNGGGIPVIITNKHVIKGASFLEMPIHISDLNFNRLRSEAWKYYDFQNSVFHHPDPKVDLCAIPIASIDKQLETKGCRHFKITLVPKITLSAKEIAELNHMENILMVGYPIGLWDEHNNKPIFRRGITATNPADDYNGKKEFVIDAACFPGSSGSPVFLFDQGTYMEKNNAIMGGSRCALLGVLWGGPQFTTEGKIEIVNIPTAQIPVSKSRIPTHLGNVIKATRILELEPIAIDALNKQKGKIPV